MLFLSFFLSLVSKYLICGHLAFQIIETMAYTEDVANFIDALGPFYEFIDIPGTKNKNNNNNKGNDKPSNDKKDDSAGDANDKPITNGLNMPNKMNGNHSLDSDSGSGSEAAQSSSQDSSPQHSREETITRVIFTFSAMSLRNIIITEAYEEGLNRRVNRLGGTVAELCETVIG